MASSCPRCGAAVEQTAAFCPACGTPFAPPPPPTVPMPTVGQPAQGQYPATQYLPQQEAPHDAVPPAGNRTLVIVMAVIAVLAVINMLGTRWGGRLSNLTTTIKIAAVVFLAALPFVTFVENLSWSPRPRYGWGKLDP